MSYTAVQIITFVIIAAAAVILIVLERLFPYNKGRKLFREGFFNDFVFYNFVQSLVLGLVITEFIRFIDSNLQVSRLRILSPFPVWMQTLFFVVAHDLYIYLFHRYQHKSKYFWRIHEAHHSTQDLDWLAGVRSHSLEILINQTIEFLPIVLLGAAPEVALYKGAISAIWGMYIHSNINVKSGPLIYLINGPEMHRWHHSDDAIEAHNKNFATKFSLWDWLFGTAYLPKEKKASRYGLSYLKFPKGYIAQHLFAFRKFDDNE